MSETFTPSAEPQDELQIPLESPKTPDELRAEAAEIFAKLDTQAMKNLANPQEQEFLAELEQGGANTESAFNEFK
jgi:hypothetical protein